MYPREASLDMEVGDYARAERLLAAVPEKDRDDGWRVVDSRYLELTGHLAAARSLLGDRVGVSERELRCAGAAARVVFFPPRRDGVRSRR